MEQSTQLIESLPFCFSLRTSDQNTNQSQTETKERQTERLRSDSEPKSNHLYR